MRLEVKILSLVFIYLIFFGNWATTCDFQQSGILTSVDSDKSMQLPFKLRNSKWCSVSCLTLIEYPSDKQGSDQIARMRKLIWVVAGRAYHIVGNIMSRLVYVRSTSSNDTAQARLGVHCSRYAISTKSRASSWAFNITAQCSFSSGL